MQNPLPALGKALMSVILTSCKSPSVLAFLVPPALSECSSCIPAQCPPCPSPVPAHEDHFSAHVTHILFTGPDLSSCSGPMGPTSSWPAAEQFPELILWDSSPHLSISIHDATYIPSHANWKTGNPCGPSLSLSFHIQAMIKCCRFDQVS